MFEPQWWRQSAAVPQTPVPEGSRFHGGAADEGGRPGGNAKGSRVGDKGDKDKRDAKDAGAQEDEETEPPLVEESNEPPVRVKLRNNGQSRYV